MSIRSPLNIRNLIGEALFSGSTEAALGRPGVWDCTTCAVCTIRCPRGLKPSEFVVALRGELVESGRVPKTVVDALDGTYKHGNPWGRPRQKRVEWKGDLTVRVIPDGKEIDWLYFVGCAPSYDPRLQRIPRILCRILDATEVDFGILATKESCCGNEIRRMGEAGLFEDLREENTKNFKASATKGIVVTSPHCFNAFANEYQLNGIRVAHYTQLVADLIEQGNLKFDRKLGKKVAYHDPCFLGKQNGIFDPPRKILQAIPGLTLLEFDRNQERSLCCEGGGGRMWIEGTGEGERNAEIRVKSAYAMDVTVIATACPFCLLTLEDAIKTAGLEGKIAIQDILELVAEATGLNNL